MALDNATIATILQEELTLSEGDEHSELEAVRELALRYFRGGAKGTEMAGRSKVNSGDFADMVEAIMSELLPIFSGSSLILFEPTSEEDEEQARLESDFVQHMIERNNGYMVIAEAVKDALMMRNGFTRIDIEEDTRKEAETLTDITEEELLAFTSMLQQDGWENISPNISGRGIDTFTARVTAEKTERSLKITSPAPENIRYSAEHDKQELEGIRFFTEREELTRSELVRQGLPKSDVAKFVSLTQRINGSSQERSADNRNINLASPHPSTELVETYNVYLMIDEDETGVAQLRRYRWVPDSEKQIYKKEDAAMVPYAHGSPYIYPHRVTGWSVFDKMRSVEDVKTTSLRQMLDNMNNMNNTRKLARTGAVNKESLLNSRPGGVIWCNDPQSDVVMEQKVPIIAESINLLGYMDKVRTEKGGASLDMMSPDFQLAAKNVGDAGADRQISKKEKLVGMMALNLANTLIKRTYMLVHEQMRLFMPGELSAKLNGVWAKTDPSEWVERKHLTVHVGLTDAERQQKNASLQLLIEGQRGMAQFGFDGTMVTEKNIYNAMRDWMQLQNFSFPDQYITDPDSPEAQQVAQQKQQAAQAESEGQKQLQQGLVDTQNALEKYKIDQKTEIDVFKEEVKLAIKEAELTASTQPLDGVDPNGRAPQEQDSGGLRRGGNA